MIIYGETAYHMIDFKLCLEQHEGQSSFFSIRENSSKPPGSLTIEFSGNKPFIYIYICICGLCGLIIT